MDKPEKLEERTIRYALDVRAFVRSIPRSVISIEDGKQLVRSSGSVGANYIEACESLSKKDFLLRIKISRKEARESRFWLQMFSSLTGQHAKDRDKLLQESTELLKIFSSIVSRS